MTEQTQSKAIVVSNYDKIKAMANNQATIQRFVEMLGNRTTAHSYITSAMLAVQNSKDLMECTPSSVFNVVMRAAALHLSCDPALKQAYIVPFYDNNTHTRKASFIPGYIGINQMALRTHKYRYLQTSELWEGQEICINQLTGAAHIEGQRKSDKVIGYFHYFELFTGLSHTYYMTVEELEAWHQRYAPKNPIWKSHFPDMCKKTVTKQNLLKFGVLDSNDRAILEEADEDRPEGELMGNDTIEGVFNEQDDAKAEEEAKIAAEAKANEPQRDPQEIINELSGQPSETPKQAPALPPLRYSPEALKARVAEIAKTMTGKPANGKRGLVVGLLNNVFASSPEPDMCRHELLKYLTGTGSSKTIPDPIILALYSWLNPTQDSGGDWIVDPMSVREALTAFNAAKPPEQESLI